MQTPTHSDNPLFGVHSRSFAANRYVYPVLSRRAGGISIGVNLNLDRACNFHCIYCQVNRSRSAEKNGRRAPRADGADREECETPSTSIDLKTLADELDRTVELVVSGRIFEGERFRHTPAPLRRLNDIALSGDGEPTACPCFDQVVDLCAEARRRHGLDDMKLVLITNASLLHRPKVRRALTVLDANGGEIWAKLDAGTEAYYRQVARSSVPWRRILDNLREAAFLRPIVIQSLWMRIRGESPSTAELGAYCDRLRAILDSGGHVKLVQIHTVARKPAETSVAALSAAKVDAIAALVQGRTGLPVATFYGGTG